MKPAFPPGHFYSPVVDPAALEVRRHVLWPEEPRPLLGIDFREEAQREFILTDMARFWEDFIYPDDDAGPGKYFLNNGLFGGQDALVLFAMLRKFCPKRIIEVGSGYSSLLIADTVQRFLGSETELVCIEPYPRQMLKDGVPGITRLVTEKVEDLAPSFFAGLGAGDVLFIDSSHVSKTGSDVNFPYFEVLPRLSPGVVIHIHDIFLPQDYPAEWVMEHQFSWNEQYVLQALLMFSSAFQVLFGSAYARHAFPGLLCQAWGRDVSAGSSFWLLKV